MNLETNVKLPRIIAVDFDGCLFVNNWPDVGEPIEGVITDLKKEQAEGAKIILWTCRIKEALHKAVDACETVGLRFDAINKNLPEVIDLFGGNPRKIFAHEYWDDRAVRKPVIFPEETNSYFSDIAIHEVGLFNSEADISRGE